MPYRVKSTNESSCVKPPNKYGIYSSSLTKAIHKLRINLLTQEYEKFSISNEETINSGFTQFNAIVTSLKYLDPDYSSKNHFRKFLRALPLKWRAMVMGIEEAKDLATLPLDELIGNLKVYEMILASDDVASKPIKEKFMPIALKANVIRGQTSNDNVCQDRSDEDEDKEEEEFNLIVRNIWKLFNKGNRYGYIKNHMKTIKNKQARTRERKSEQKPEANHVAMVKAQIYVGFALNSLTKEAQAVTSRNDSLAILRYIKLSYHGDKFDRGRGGRSKGVGSSRRERRCYGCGSKNHFVDDCLRAKVKKAFISGAWSDSNDDD
ncbi:UBN2 domain-containing protein [Tanacetum coccineum]